MQVRTVLSWLDSDKMKETFSGFKKKPKFIPPILSLVHIQNTSREHTSLTKCVCIYAAILTSKINIVRYEVIEDNISQSGCCWFFFCFVFVPVFLQSLVYKRQSYILLLKSDATVLALPSIDRQWKYSLHQFLGTLHALFILPLSFYITSIFQLIAFFSWKFLFAFPEVA